VDAFIDYRKDIKGRTSSGCHVLMICLTPL